MKTVIDSSAFLASLRRIVRIVEDEPLLKAVQLTSAGQTLALHAAALDFEIVDVVPAEIGQPGSSTLSARLLLDAAVTLPDGPGIVIEFDEPADHLILSVGDASVQLAASPGRYFAALNIDTFVQPFAPTVTVPARDLPALLGHVVTVPTHDEDPFTREGRHLRIPTPRPADPDRAEIPGPPGFDGKQGVLVPLTTVAELTRLCDVDGDISIEVNEDCVRLSIGSVMLTSRQVDAPSSYLA